MDGIETSTCPSGWLASLVTLPVIVTGSCAASRTGSARNALRMMGTNRPRVSCMSPPTEKRDTHDRSRRCGGPARLCCELQPTDRVFARTSRTRSHTSVCRFDKGARSHNGWRARVHAERPSDFGGSYHGPSALVISRIPKVRQSDLSGHVLHYETPRRGAVIRD